MNILKKIKIKNKTTQWYNFKTKKEKKVADVRFKQKIFKIFIFYFIISQTFINCHANL